MQAFSVFSKSAFKIPIYFSSLPCSSFSDFSF